MTHDLLTAAIKATQAGETLPEDVSEWLLAGLTSYLLDEQEIGLALGLNGAQRRAYWLSQRNKALLQGWTHIKQTTDLSNRQAAHELYYRMCEGDEDIEDLLEVIHQASEHCGSLNSGQSIYGTIWMLINDIA